MAIMITFTPQSMTPDQYDELIRQLEAAGAEPPAGRLYHAAAGNGDNLHVVDVWESPQAFEAFGQHLLPILQQLGVSLPPPEIAQVHRMVKA